MFWVLVSYESPAEHPTISDEERCYIEESIGESAKLTGPSEVRGPSPFNDDNKYKVHLQTVVCDA